MTIQYPGTIFINYICILIVIVSFKITKPQGFSLKIFNKSHKQTKRNIVYCYSNCHNNTFIMILFIDAVKNIHISIFAFVFV